MRSVSLKSRIILSLVIIVTVTSTLFAIGVLLIKAQLEEVIFGDMVHDQLQVFSEQLSKDQYTDNLLFNDWQFYFDERADSLPTEIKSLELGSHHSVLVEQQYYQVEVASLNDELIYLTYNITDWENQEHELLELLVYGVGIVLIAAIFMGLQASQTILSPVRKLTKRLSSIEPSDRKVRIAKEFKGNEIEQIASAFDHYLDRLDQFVEREQSFTAAASHELRTPLSVMMGALDVLEENEQTATSQRALARIKRACGEMLAFIEATLFLSRESETTIQQDKNVDITKIISSVIEDNESSIKSNGIKIATNIIAIPKLDQPISIIQITIANILRNAIEHTSNGEININLDSNSLTIIDTGCGIEKDNLPHIFDRSFTTKQNGTGMGLNLVKRICDRFNWKIEFDSDLGGGTKVLIQF